MEIQKTIDEYNNEIYSMKKQKETLEKQKCGYCSINEVNNELNHIEEEINTLNDEIAKMPIYRTSKEIKKELHQYPKGKAFLNILSIRDSLVGDYVKFGSYNQNKGEKTDIEWIVLEKNEGKTLIISRYALDCKPYNEEYEDVTWETCSLRSWLNDDFIAKAFTIDEKKYICETTVKADDNPKYDTNPGDDTQDKIFLLSINEVRRYFTKQSDRKCSATEYADEEGAYINDGSCAWWLRSPGDDQDIAACIGTSGAVTEYGERVNYGSRAVRPALWINLEL
jgi:hypothetical protein